MFCSCVWTVSEKMPGSWDMSGKKNIYIYICTNSWCTIIAISIFDYILLITFQCIAEYMDKRI